MRLNSLGRTVVIISISAQAEARRDTYLNIFFIQFSSSIKFSELFEIVRTTSHEGVEDTYIKFKLNVSFE